MLWLYKWQMDTCQFFSLIALGYWMEGMNHVKR